MNPHIFRKPVALRKSVMVGLIAVFTLAACEGGVNRDVRAKESGEIGRQYADDPPDSLFGGGGILGSGGKEQANAGSGGIGVNSYLWRATLDTISFLPVTSADPFGGVILTDWYAPPETPNERFKLNVYVLGRALRADGVQVSVFRQARDSVGGWRDTAVDADTARRIEDSILTRARQLRNENRALQN